MLATAARAPHSLGLMDRVDGKLFTGTNGHPAEERPVLRSPRVVKLQCSSPQASDVGIHDAGLSWAPLDLSEGCGVATYAVDVQLLQPGNKAAASATWRSIYTGGATTCKASGLLAGREYVARLSATVLPGSSSSSPAVNGAAAAGEAAATPPVVYEVLASQPRAFKTVATLPAAPPPPSLSTRTRNSLKLKWCAPDEPGGDAPLTFVLHINPAPTGVPDAGASEGFVEVYRGEEKAFKVAKLQAGVRYSVRIKAINPVGEGPLSLCSAYTTQATVPTQPDPPLPVASTSSSVTLEWSPPWDNGASISSYQLEGDGGRGGNDFSLVYAGQLTRTTVADLKSGTLYRFRLMADNSVRERRRTGGSGVERASARFQRLLEGKSTWSTVMTATTAAQPPACPVGVTLVASERGAATVSWSAASADTGGSPVTGYEVQLQAKTRAAVDHMGVEWLLIFVGEATACTINSLRPGCTYRVRVRAGNKAGLGQWCLPVDVMTAPDVPDMAGEPCSLELLPHSATLQWLPPKHDGGARVTLYRVELAEPACVCGMCMPGQPRQCDSSAIKLVYSGEAATARVAALEPGCRYQVRVQASNAQGSGPWTAWQPVFTPAASPLECPPPQFRRPTASSFQARWLAPHAQGAPISGYILQAAAVGPAPRRADGGAAPLPQHLHEASLAFRTVFRGAEAESFVNGLEPDTMYALRVAAINAAGTGPWSAATAAVTGAAAPGAPESLAGRTAGSHAVALTWRPPARDFGAPITAYVAEYCTTAALEACAAAAAAAANNGRPRGGGGGAASSVASSPTWQVCYEGPAPYCTVGGLQPGRSYTFHVRAANACGSGPLGETAAGSTAAAPPGAPQRPLSSLRMAGSVRLKWAEVLEEHGAPVTDYCVEQSADGGASWVAVYTGRDTSHRAADLLPGHRYAFRVTAVNSAGRSLASPSETVTTLLSPPKPPAAVSATLVEATKGDASSHSLVVTWEVPEASPTAAEPMSYEVVAAAHGDIASSASARQVVAGGGATQCRLGGLHPATHYIVRLRAVGADSTGHSGWSVDVPVLTPGRAAAAASSSEVRGGGADAQHGGGGGAGAGSVSPPGSVAEGAAASGRNSHGAVVPRPQPARKAGGGKPAPAAAPPSAQHRAVAGLAADDNDGAISSSSGGALLPAQPPRKRARADAKWVPGAVAPPAARGPPARRNYTKKMWRLMARYKLQLMALMLVVVLVAVFLF